MKKLSTLLTLLLCLSLTASAQTWTENNHFLKSSIIGNIGKDYAKVISESTQGTDNNTGYAYMEAGFGLKPEASNYLYAQFFWEQKFWETPLFIHGEFRTTLFDGQFDNIHYLGAAYCFYTPHGFAAIEPLYRYNKHEGHGYQLSIVGGWDWERFDLAEYFDWWGNRASDFVPRSVYSETRGYFKINKRFEIGAVLILSKYFDDPVNANLFGGLKVNL
ncbi:MAG: hypothetical protein J6Z27_02570 [Bacteroidales bacterium]|nr:hypothetical protein [Bacteroidales bacterium]